MTTQYYITKKAGDKIMKALPGILKECGFVALPPDKWHEFTKESAAGKVEISVRYKKAYMRRGYDICIYGLFDDPKKARDAGIDCNPYSGKYNHLFILTEENLRYCLNQYK